MPKVTIERMSTNEANVSKRHIWFDVYVDGKYNSSHQDIFDAFEAKEQAEVN